MNFNIMNIGIKSLLVASACCAFMACEKTGNDNGNNGGNPSTIDETVVIGEYSGTMGHFLRKI